MTYANTANITLGELFIFGSILAADVLVQNHQVIYRQIFQIWM